MKELRREMLSDTKWMAQWESIKPLTDRWIAVGETHHLSAHALIVIMDGTAVWSINGNKTNVCAGQLFAIEKNSMLEVINRGNSDLVGWITMFHTYRLHHDQGTVEKYEWHVPYRVAYQKVDLSEPVLARLGHKLSELSRGDASLHWHAAWTGGQQVVYEMLNELYSQKINMALPTEQGLKLTTEYIHNHYGEKVTRTQLAEVASMSPWHYTRKFTEHYGQSPLDYLAHFRMYRALEHLILTSEKSELIAKKVGYDDPHYFSRRFKQLTGVSPRNYISTMSQRRIVCLSALFAVTLIDIGIIPYAVVVTAVLLPQYQLNLFIEHQVRMLEVSQYQVDASIIRQANPEIIIGNPHSEELVEEMRVFAPVITGLSREPEQLLHQLGTLFHREEQALQLQLQMKTEIEKASIALQPFIKSGITVMVLRVEQFAYRFFGKYSNGISRLLYQQLGFSFPQVLESGEAWCNPCSLEQLSAANPDYLFVEKRMMQDFSAEESMQNLVKSQVWSNLSAVQNNHVTYVSTNLWIDSCGFHGQKMILDQIMASMLSQNESKAQ